MFEEIKRVGCRCGRTHVCSVRDVITGAGAVKKLPESLKMLGASKPFVVTDKNTLDAAGHDVLSVLDGHRIHSVHLCRRSYKTGRARGRQPYYAF